MFGTATTALGILFCILFGGHRQIDAKRDRGRPKMGWDGGPQSPCLDPHLQRGQRDASFEGCTSLQGVQRERRGVGGGSLSRDCCAEIRSQAGAHLSVMTDNVRIRSCSPEMRSWKLRHLGCAALDSFTLDASPPVSGRHVNMDPVRSPNS
jgi:hypothetical protein